MSYRRALGSACLALSAWCAEGCGATTFDGHVFKNADLSFRFAEVPSDWRPLESDDALLAFRDDSAPASIVVNGRCGRDADDVPLSALTHHLFLQFSDRVIENQVKITLDGREALHTELLAKLDGVEKRFGVFVMKKNGCVYDFVYIAPPSAPAESRQRFVSFVQGFSTISP